MRSNQQVLTNKHLAIRYFVHCSLDKLDNMYFNLKAVADKTKVSLFFFILKPN